MKSCNREETVNEIQKADEGKHLPFGSFLQNKVQIVFGIVFVVSAICFGISFVSGLLDDSKLKLQQETLQKSKQEAENHLETLASSGNGEGKDTAITAGNKADNMGKNTYPEMLPEYEALYEQNEDFIGWLKIEDTIIDYPVMQCKEDENFYLSHDFYKKENKNGCLILDNDSRAGVGTKDMDYENGETPSTNLIIHGHMMRSGQMFGKLNLYREKEYGLSHNIISFDSLYEKRTYEVIAVFYSQVFYEKEQVFKYYQFFQAETKEEFDDWYHNIKKKSLYDTGVTAEFGDEFLTLSVCSYHVEDGRFVVVGKRIL